MNETSCSDHPAIARAITTGYPEPEEYREQVFVCSGCGDSIREGDQYVDLLGELFCMECIAELTFFAEAAFGEED